MNTVEQQVGLREGKRPLKASPLVCSGGRFKPVSVRLRRLCFPHRPRREHYIGSISTISSRKAFKEREKGCADQEGNTQQTVVKVSWGTSLVVQWLKLCTPNAGAEGSITGSHMPELGVRTQQLKVTSLIRV